MQNIDDFHTEFTVVFWLVMALAVVGPGVWLLLRWLRKLGHVGETPWVDQDRASYEAAERENDLVNNLRGGGPCWYHNGRGSGLRRGRR